MNYKFNEGEILKELKEYIDGTYGQHYSSGKIQSTEFIIDAGHGEGFALGNIIKYATRHRKKNGVEDIKKIIHYCELLLELEYAEECKEEGSRESNGEEHREGEGAPQPWLR